MCFTFLNEGNECFSLFFSLGPLQRYKKTVLADLGREVLTLGEVLDCAVN